MQLDSKYSCNEEDIHKILIISHQHNLHAFQNPLQCLTNPKKTQSKTKNKKHQHHPQNQQIIICKFSHIYPSTASPSHQYITKNPQHNSLGVQLPITISQYIIKQYQQKIPGKNIMNTRLKWTAQQEQILRVMGSLDIKNKWLVISKHLNKKQPLNPKTPKQCRQRYTNFLVFEENGSDTNWTLEQDEILFKQYKEYGSKWKKISQKLTNKSQNTVKNHFYGNLRKTIRKLNNIAKQNIGPKFKQIQQKSILKILEFDVTQSSTLAHSASQIMELRQQLINIIQIGIKQNIRQQELDYEYYLGIVRRVQKCVCLCRFLRNTKRAYRRNVDNNKLDGVKLGKDHDQGSEVNHAPASINESSQPDPDSKCFIQSNIKLEPQLLQHDHRTRPILSAQNQLPHLNSNPSSMQKQTDGDHKWRLFPSQLSTQLSDSGNIIQSLYKYVQQYCLQNQIRIQ